MNATHATGAGVVATIPGAASGGILHIVYIYIIQNSGKKRKEKGKIPCIKTISTMIYDTQL